MGPKKVSAKDSVEKKKRMISTEQKHEIIKKHEHGVRVVDIAREYSCSTSTICTTLKQKDQIMSITPANGSTIISKRRSSVTEEVEGLLLLLPGM